MAITYKVGRKKAKILPKPVVKVNGWQKILPLNWLRRCIYIHQKEPRIANKGVISHLLESMCGSLAYGVLESMCEYIFGIECNGSYMVSYFELPWNIVIQYNHYSITTKVVLDIQNEFNPRKKDVLIGVCAPKTIQSCVKCQENHTCSINSFLPSH